MAPQFDLKKTGTLNKTMSISQLAAIEQKVNEASGTLSDQFNFGNVYKCKKFEDAIKSSRFRSWIEYILTLEDQWTITQADDMENFREFLDLKCDKEDYPRGDILAQLDYLEEMVERNTPPMFRIGKYKNVPLDKVPREHKLWFVSKTFREHPTTDVDFWKTAKGRRLERLIVACEI